MAWKITIMYKKKEYHPTLPKHVDLKPGKPTSYLKCKGYFKLENIKELCDWPSSQTYIYPNVEEAISFWTSSQKNVFCLLWRKKPTALRQYGSYIIWKY